MLNIEDFNLKLDTDVFGRNFVYLDEVESTNSFLLSSKEYDEHGTVVLAESQTLGRGRKNRRWSSNREQNLTFSLLISKKIKKLKINLLHFAASLTVAQALENLYQLRINLKWPNDVLVNDKKISGILMESISRGDKIEKVVVGIGININQPSFTGRFDIPPTSVKMELKRDVSRERLLNEILNLFEYNFKMLRKQPEKILNDWRSRCKMIGEKIKIADDEIEKFGIFEDVDENGFLILKLGENRETINYGDVSLRQQQ